MVFDSIKITMSDIGNEKLSGIPLSWSISLAAIFVAGWSWDMGAEVITQAERNLGRFQAQSLTYEVTVFSLSRGLIPTIVGMFLSCYTVVIGAVEYFRIRKIDVSDIEKQRFLISSRLRFIAFLFPTLSIFGLLVAFTSARFASSQGTRFTSESYGELMFTVGKAIILSLPLLALAFLQWKALIKWNKTVHVVAICLIAIFINIMSVTILSSVMSRLL